MAAKTIELIFSKGKKGQCLPLTENIALFLML